MTAFLPPDQIVAEARTWLGTPRQHQAPMKGVGCDCVGFVRGVISALRSLPPAIKRTDYSRTPDGVTLLRVCRENLFQVKVSELRVGDIMVFSFKGGRPQHLAIAGNYVHGGLSMIHALDSGSDRYGSVVEHHLSPAWRRRIVAVFRVPAA